MNGLLPLLLGSAICSLGLAMDPFDDTPDDAPDGSELQVAAVEHPPEYVLGFPMYLAMTLHADESTGFRRLLFPDFFSLRSALGVDAAGPSSISVHLKPIIEADFGRRGQALPAGESRRFLTDVSPLFLLARPGIYTARFTFIAPEISVEAKPVTLRFREPTVAELAVLKRVAPDREKEPTWGQWILTCPDADIDPADVRQPGPLAFALALRFLLCGSEPLREVDPKIFDGLTGIYAPERDAIKAELYALRGNQAEAARLRQAVTATKGMGWWADRYFSILSKRPEQAP